MTHDVVIVGGGPAGLSAALALGRARKRVLLCDSGPRRNAAAERISFTNAVDGTLLFPGAAEEGSHVFSDVPVTNGGELDDIMFWRHTGGGKFPE